MPGKVMRLVTVLIAFTFVIGCATAPVTEEPAVTEEPVTEQAHEISTVPAKQDGVVTKLRGLSYIQDTADEEYIVLRQGDSIPIGRIFYLAPKTTMKIEVESGGEIYLYSKDHESYFMLETNSP